MISEAGVDIYDESLKVVASSPGAGEIVGPVSAGTNIALPNSQTYSSMELQVYLNGDRLESVFDYSYVGSIPRTQIQFTFSLEVGDRIDFRIDRSLQRYDIGITDGKDTFRHQTI